MSPSVCSHTRQRCHRSSQCVYMYIYVRTATSWRKTGSNYYISGAAKHKMVARSRRRILPSSSLVSLVIIGWLLLGDCFVDGRRRRGGRERLPIHEDDSGQVNGGSQRHNKSRKKASGKTTTTTHSGPISSRAGDAAFFGKNSIFFGNSTDLLQILLHKK